MAALSIGPADDVYIIEEDSNYLCQTWKLQSHVFRIVLGNHGSNIAIHDLNDGSHFR